jgi:hypothetical protein
MSLELVKTKDDKFKEEYPNLIKKINYRKLKEFDPKIDEIEQVYKIIKDFIIEKKRKIYGGYALNLLLKQKDPKLAIYDDFELTQADIEFYSSTPMEDLVELCNKIYEAGFKPVTGQEAQHKETYSVFVNYRQYCDITYIPNNINRKARFITIDNMYLIHPWFMMIDYFRMFTDPLTSYWRLEKHFERYKRVEKVYPLPLIQKPLSISSYKDKGVSEAINLIFDYITEKQSVLLTGFYVYNYYLYQSDYKKYNKNYEYITIPYLEAYSTNYIQDGLDIMEFIKTMPESLANRITLTEYFPFFQFYGYNFVLYYNDGTDAIPILYFYSNNKKCIPYKQVDYIKFDNLNKLKPTLDINKKINIGCFDHNILHSLIILVKVRVDDDNEWNDILYKLINCFVTFRNYYLEKNKKSIYDDTIFQGFVLDCMGETILPDREKRLLGEARKKAGKPYNYKYEPSVSKPPGKYTFANSSGNKIIKDSQLKLKKENLTKNLLDEFEEIESSESSEENKEIQTSEIITDTVNTSEQLNSLDTTETSDETDISK